MKKISINDTKPEEKVIVDDELLLEHNQISSDTETETEMTGKKDSIMNIPSRLFIVLTVVAVLAGVGTGFGTYRLTAKTQTNSNTRDIVSLPSEAGIKNGDEFGSSDAAFDSNAIGYIEQGGFDGEGSHKLLRPGGDSQTVYLTSSVTDLDLLVGMEVELWGETFKGQKAGWFMDVGRVKVIEVEGESPAEE
jgi:hypothetical protein